jgi:alkylation response protein AidB-like acyl-CoA dehydrogenase
LGVLYAFADEDAGGMGGSGFDIAVVFEELGRALCPEPLLPALMAIRAGVHGRGRAVGGDPLRRGLR